MSAEPWWKPYERRGAYFDELRDLVQLDEVDGLVKACRTAAGMAYLAERNAIPTEAERVEFVIRAALGHLLGHGLIEARLPEPGTPGPPMTIPDHLRPKPRT